MPLKLVELEGVSRSNAYQIPPEHLQQGENPRAVADKEIRTLAESILAQGQIVPVVIYTDKEGEPHILDGNRRVAAIRFINEHMADRIMAPLKVRCEVYKGPDAYEASVVATHKRKAFSPVDLAHIIKTLEEKGKSRKEIAKLLEVSEPLISRALKLLRLPAKHQREVHAGRQSAEWGYEMADLTEKDREELERTSQPEAEPSQETGASSRPEAEASQPEAKTAAPTRKAIRKLKREKAERGEQTRGPKGLSRLEIREVFAGWSVDESIEEPIQKVSAAVVKCIDGEVGIRAVLNRLRELATAE